MKANYRTRDGRIVVEVQGETVKDLFRGIGQAQEVFEAAACCGACESPNIQFRTRTIEDNDYFELSCQDCHSKLDFGQHKKGGTLFAKRKDSDGSWLPNAGWRKWEQSQTKSA